MMNRVHAVGSQWASSATVLAWLLLLALGAVMVNSATVAMAGALTEKHVVSMVLALIALVFMIVIPLEWWRRVHKLLLVAGVLFCALVLIPAVGTEVKGARRWIQLGGYSMQASEVVKPLVLIYLAATSNGSAICWATARST